MAAAELLRALDDACPAIVDTITRKIGERRGSHFQAMGEAACRRIATRLLAALRLDLAAGSTASLRAAVAEAIAATPEDASFADLRHLMQSVRTIVTDTLRRVPELVPDLAPVEAWLFEGAFVTNVQFLARREHVLHSRQTHREVSALEIRLGDLAAQNLALERRVEERTQELQATLARLNATMEQLVESEKLAALGGLVAGVAHEINTPVGNALTAISALSERLDDLQDGDDLGRTLNYARRCCMSVRDNLDRAGALIQSFREVAVDRSVEALREIDLRGYLERVLVSLEPQLQRAGIRLQLDVPPDLMFWTDPGTIAQIVTNLLMNSLQHAFTPGAGGQIGLTVRGTADEVTLGFADDGRGIRPEDHKRIFDPFFTTRRGQGGTGLGLHIVYNLVTARLRGTIHCDSAVGQGTRFTISLPSLRGEATAS